MMNRSRKFSFIFTIFVAVFIAAWWGTTTTTYYIVRHAEKLTPEADALSEAGFARAAVLRDLLLDKGIDTVFHSEKLRSAQTAQPFISAQSPPVVVYQTSAHDAFIPRLSAIKDRQILVVSHSNLVPELVLWLANRHINNIAETDFDNLYVVKVRWLFNIAYRRTVQEQTYGAETR